MFGVVEAGTFGRTGTLKDIDTAQVTHKKSRKESDFTPYYFRAYVPDDHSKAILVAQKIGVEGFVPAVQKDLLGYCRRMDITMQWGTLTHGDMLNEYLTGGELEGIRVITHKKQLNSDEAVKKARIDGEELEDGTRYEVVLRRAKGLGKAIDTVKSVAFDGKPIQDLVEVQGLSHPEDVIVEVNYENRKRSFSIMRPGSAGIRYDLSNAIKFDANGHPIFKSIDRYARTLCRELSDKIH